MRYLFVRLSICEKVIAAFAAAFAFCRGEMRAVSFAAEYGTQVVGA